MQIALLGPLDVRTDDGGSTPVAGARLSRLLILLAIHPRTVVSTTAIVDAVWGEAPPDEPANAVQALVSRLRRAVPGISITSRATGYVLDVPPRSVDVEAFTAGVATGMRTGDRDALAEALALWRGEPLVDAGDAEFAQPIRARLEETRLNALQARISLDIEAGTADVAELEGLVSAYPLREALIVLLMRALHAAGDRSRALSVFDEARKRLADELGIAPNPALAAEHVRILRADEEPVSEPVSDVRITGNLRAELSSFVGRDADLEGIAYTLRQHRLTTLIGPGGAGKTRLAAHAGRDRVDATPGGVWMIEFAPVTDPGDVVTTVLGALGMRAGYIVRNTTGASAVETDPLDRLLAGLAHRDALLIFDNCEHLIEATARLAAEVLGACPGIRILATSREPLGVPGEVLWPVEPLALPPADAQLDELVTYPSVRLFAQRAAAVRPGFAVTEAHADAVVRICRALDGMPLAIELAAARMRSMTPEQVADRLGDRFSVLTGGSRTVLPRHQTLRAVVDWSWELLGDDERVLWRRLSVFSGGATLAAAEAVADRDVFVLDAVSALVDKSLLQVRDDGFEPRYVMLETIRAYGQMRLDEAGEHTLARLAHSAYFADLVVSARDHLIGADQLEWLARLSADHDNLNVAVRYAVAAGAIDIAVRLVSSAGWYWRIGGNRREGTDLTVLALDLLANDPMVESGDIADQAVETALEERAAAYAVGALMAVESETHMAYAMEWFDRAAVILDRLPEPQMPFLRLVRPVRRMFQTFETGRIQPGVEVGLPVDDEDPWVAGMGRVMRGHVMLNFGRDHAQAEADFRSAFELFQGIGERWGMSFTLISLASVEAWRGEIAEAIADTVAGIRSLSELGVWDDVAQFRANLARLLWLQGDHAAAYTELARAEREAERIGLSNVRGGVALAAADLARFDGDLVEADHWFRVAEAALAVQPVGGQFRALVASTHAYLAAARGDLDEARRLHREAVAIAVDSIDAPVIAATLVGLADITLADGDGPMAARILGASTAVRGMPDLSLVDELRVIEACRRALGEAEFEIAYARGAAATAIQIGELVGIAMPEITASSVIPDM